MRLPSATDLGQAPELHSQGVVPIQLGRAEEAQVQAAEMGKRDANTLSNVGNTLYEIGQRIQQRQDRNNYIKEKSNFLQTMVAAENEIGSADDTDYKTFVPRLNDKLQKAKQESAGKIQNPDMRAQFEADTDLDIEQGIIRMASKSWALEKSNGVADMNQTIANNRELYLTAGDDSTRESLLDNSNKAIEAARVNGYITPDEAEEMGRKSAEDYAIGRISVMPPDARLGLLSKKGTLADFIPADKRQALIEKAQSESITNLHNMEWKAQQAREKMFNDNSLLVEQTGSVAGIPPEQWAAMDKGQRDALSTYAKNIAEGNNIPTDWNTYYQLKTQAADPTTLRSFEREDLTKYRGKLGPTEYKELIGAQESIRQGKGVKELDGYLTKKQIVDDALSGIGVDPTPKPGKQAKDVANFHRMVDNEIAAVEKVTGKKATNEEVQKITDKLTVQGRVPGSGIIFDDKKRRFQLEPGESLEVDGKTVVAGNIKDVPAAERVKIEAALRRNGRPVNDTEILYRYNQKLEKAL